MTPALIDFVAEQPGILLDAPGDPRLGMAGESYGGGIQLATAAFDPRIDALAPQITWHSLVESLYPGEVIKLGWIAALQGLGVPSSAVLGLAPDSRAQIETGTLAPEVYEALVSGLATNTLSAEAQDFFLDASLARYGAEHPVTVPTMLLQGFNDTLFPFHQALESVDALAAAGAPVKLVGFCGSLSSAATGTGSGIVHGECPPWYSTEGNDARFQDLHVRWFDRWLRGEGVDTGPAVEVSSNEGVWHTLADATAFPGPGVETVTATLAGTLPASPLPSGGGAAVFATRRPAPVPPWRVPS